MFRVDALTHHVALNPVSHCNAHYAYTTPHEHWIAKFGLTKILVTDNGTDLKIMKSLHYALIQY